MTKQFGKSFCIVEHNKLRLTIDQDLMDAVGCYNLPQGHTNSLTDWPCLMLSPTRSQTSCGTVPEKKFQVRSNFLRFSNRPSSLGIVPVNLLSVRAKSVKAVHSPISIGNVPSKKLRPNRKFPGSNEVGLSVSVGERTYVGAPTTITYANLEVCQSRFQSFLLFRCPPE